MDRTLKDIFQSTVLTDKDRDGGHCYANIYTKLLSKYKADYINLLEIGVCLFGGGGLLSFAEYFKNGTMWGIDIEKSQCLKEVIEHPRVRFIEGDAYSLDTLNKLGDTKFDIIIDDCNHHPKSQIIAFEMYFPYLKNNGIYIIEDVYDLSEWNIQHMVDLKKKYNCMSIIYDMTYTGRIDDILITIERN